MKTCELCKTEFQCSKDKDCWCMDIPIVYIASEYQDCLCPTCLKEAHDKETRRTFRFAH
jgi:hypothetical protein